MHDINDATVRAAVDDIRSRMLLVRLRTAQFDPEIKDRKATEAMAARHNASADSVSGRKRLVPRHAIDPIARHIRSAREWFKGATLPWLYDGAGVAPSVRFFELNEEFDRIKRGLAPMVDAFVEGAPGWIAEARTKLGDLFDEKEFPTGDLLRRRFVMDLDVEPLPDGNDLRTSAPAEMVADLRQRYDRRLREGVEGARAGLVDRLKERIGRYAERLSNPDNVFKNSMVEKLRELLDIASDMNITDDPDIHDVIVDARKFLAPHEPETLREDVFARASAKAAADHILARLGIL